MTDVRQKHTWQDVMRPEVEAAWHALDRSQLVLYREYADTGDEQIRQLKDRLERASDALIDAVIDELFPETDTDGALDADAAGSAQDVDL